jgi:AcrR family transcriptional regulator
MRSTKSVGKRQYRLGQRAETAGQTRRRIIEATLSVHDEQGITRTTVRDVASRASVAPSTVLHHFPRMDDLIQACGELSDALAPMPTPDDLGPPTDPATRVRRMTAGLFEWWDQLGDGWDHLQVDRRTLPRVDEWLREVADRHRRLVVSALVDAKPPEIELVTAMTTRGVWRSLRDSGASTIEAAHRVAAVINQRQEKVH